MAKEQFFIWLMGLLLVLTVSTTGCTNPENDTENNPEVPSWAQGVWHVDPPPSSPRVKVAEITSTQYIAYQAQLEGENIAVYEALRLDCTGVNGDTVIFGAWEIRRLTSPDQISSGTSGAFLTFYK
jgi:hypothetical protein